MLFHGKEDCVWGDAGYPGIERHKEHKHRKVDWFIAIRPGKHRLLAKNSEGVKAAVTPVDDFYPGPMLAQCLNQ